MTNDEITRTLTIYIGIIGIPAYDGLDTVCSQRNSDSNIDYTETTLLTLNPLKCQLQIPSLYYQLAESQGLRGSIAWSNFTITKRNSNSFTIENQLIAVMSPDLESRLNSAIHELKTDNEIYHIVNGNLTTGSKGLKQRKTELLERQYKLSKYINDYIISRIEREEYHMDDL